MHDHIKTELAYRLLIIMKLCVLGKTKNKPSISEAETNEGQSRKEEFVFGFEVIYENDISLQWLLVWCVVCLLMV